MSVQTIRLTQLGDDRKVQASAVLEEAAKQALDEIMVVGRTNEGELWAFSSLNAGQSLWLIEKLKERVLDGNPWSIV